jgi:septal ring factor EnvC (AmiA/AmiB activator)
MQRLVLLALFAVVVTAGQARAEFYQWTDRDGRQFYTNEKEKIPAEYRSSAQPVEVHEERVSTAQQPAGGPSPAVKVGEHKDKYGRGEAYWRKRAETLRRQIRDQKSAYDLIVKQEREDEERPKNQSAKSRKKTQSNRDKKKAKIEKKIAQLQHELDVQLPEEARKADAYPGWVRD